MFGQSTVDRVGQRFKGAISLSLVWSGGLITVGSLVASHLSRYELPIAFVHSGLVLTACATLYAVVGIDAEIILDHLLRLQRKGE